MVAEHHARAARKSRDCALQIDDAFIGHQPDLRQTGLASHHCPHYSARVTEHLNPAQRLSEVNAAIRRAAVCAGRDPAAIDLIAISKMHDAAEIRSLIAAGQRVFGENRVHEAATKWPALRDERPGIALHLVGQLQSNKAADAVALFDVIHSIDRSSLVTALAKAMDVSGRRPVCFVQVDLADEPQKGGCAVGNLSALLNEARIADLPVVGLMCVPPAGLEPAPWFALLAKLAADHGLSSLSMGMSGDYPTAVTLGATHVRVGTALFGSRG